MKSKIGLLCCLSVISFGFMSCAPTTKLTTVWKDETLHGKKVEKIFVIGMLQDKSERELLENEFVEGLKARGNDAVMSPPDLSFEKSADKETVKSAAEVSDRDAILTTKQIDIKIVPRVVPTEAYAPCIYRNWPVNPEPCWNTDFAGGITMTKDTFLVWETNLYDARTQKLLWSAQAELWVGWDNSAALIKSFVKAMLDRLSQDKVI